MKQAKKISKENKLEEQGVIFLNKDLAMYLYDFNKIRNLEGRE
jgi:hypothetical protein